jgi:hypothetical protein
VHALAVALVAIHGLVMMGPTKPVCQVGEPCSKPAANVQLVFTRSTGAKVLVRTDSRGRYSVRLARGTYTANVLPPRTIGRGIEPRTFTVRSTTVRIDFDIDTGIR